MNTMTDIGARSKAAQKSLATAGGSVIDKALLAIATALEKNSQYILEENAKDICKRLINMEEKLAIQAREYL